MSGYDSTYVSIRLISFLGVSLSSATLTCDTNRLQEPVSDYGVQSSSATSGPPKPLAAVIVNFNTVARTLKCIASLLALGRVVERIIVIDNASESPDRKSLSAGIKTFGPSVRLFENDVNLGFAGACNQGIAHCLEDPGIERVLLLNSDAIAYPAMADWIKSEHGDMAAATVVKTGDQNAVDSCGIVMYATALASNRLRVDEPLFGPTGGCAIYTRQFLEGVRTAHGYVFDPDFFCYAEDTDLAARGLLLGYQASHFDQVVAEHVGQASSGGGFNSFVLYHGIRNSIWTVAKCFPVWSLLKRLPLIFVLHAGICIRHAMKGQIATVFRLYMDALIGLPGLLRKRRVVQRSRVVRVKDFDRAISRRFYESDYLARAVRELTGWRKRVD